MKHFIFVGLLSVVANVANAAPIASTGILTNEELSQLNGINETYQQTLVTLGLSERQNELSLLSSNRRDAMERRALALSKADDLIASFREELENNKDTTVILAQLNKQAEYVQKQHTEIEGMTIQITKLTKEVEELSKLVADASWAKEQDIQSLKNMVEDRLIAESNTLHSVNIQGETNCSPSESLTACLKKKEDLLVQSYFESKGLVPQIKLAKLSGATMDLSGKVNYGINVDYTIPYSATMSRNLNFELGIKSIAINLGSNVEASYYIDGNKVGDGKEVKIMGEYFGSRVIEARYADERQSSIENLVDNAKYYYPFKVRAIN